MKNKTQLPEKISFKKEWDKLILPDDWNFRTGEEKENTYRKFESNLIAQKVNEIISYLEAKEQGK